ncbi:MAG: response regulator transcription factor [Sulfurisoma sp.]|nr:response regulator transcription factor [Sulfurisoma sp.]
MKLRILLADDHQMFREALRSLLEKDPRLDVAAETGDGLEVLRLVGEMSPDIVCMDINMPGMNGIETTRQITAAWPSVRVIALSAFSEPQYIQDMMNAGAAAYVTKAAAGAELLRAIDAASRDRTYLCPDATDAVKGILSGHGDETKGPARIGARERQVLQLVAAGFTSAQIADQLHIAASTVEVHRRNIMRKLDLHSVAGLTRYAIRNGLVPD